MSAPRLLVIEGDTAAGRAAWRADLGETLGEGYARVLRALAPGSETVIVEAADAGAALPEGGLAGFDGAAITGSALHVHEGAPEALRQVALAREVFAAGLPFFGSCWGLQVAAVAAGGAVARNPGGREVGIARGITLTEAGRAHPMLRGRPAGYDAPCSHLDAVVALPPDADVLASNALTAVQAAEVRHAGGTFWGVQYHPEFSLREAGRCVAKVAPALAAEGLSADEAAARALGADMMALAADPTRRDLAWRLGAGPEVLDEGGRTLEIRNWIDRMVRPAMSARGRA